MKCWSRGFLFLLSQLYSGFLIVCLITTATMYILRFQCMAWIPNPPTRLPYGAQLLIGHDFNKTFLQINLRKCFLKEIHRGYGWAKVEGSIFFFSSPTLKTNHLWSYCRCNHLKKKTKIFLGARPVKYYFRPMVHHLGYAIQWSPYFISSLV